MASVDGVMDADRRYMAVKVGNAILRVERGAARKQLNSAGSNPAGSKRHPAVAGRPKDDASTKAPSETLAVARKRYLGDLADGYIHVCMASFAVCAVLAIVARNLASGAYWGVAPLTAVAVASGSLALALRRGKGRAESPSNLVFWLAVSGGVVVGVVVLAANFSAGLV